MFGLEFLKLTHERVILVVGDPRLVENVTCCPFCGAPAKVQLTLRDVAAPRGMSIDDAGAVKAKLAVLTFSVWVLEVPPPVAVTTSEIAVWVAVTTAASMRPTTTHVGRA